MNLSYFHARMYDPSIGRFWGVDPEAESFERYSSYHYAGNNPAMMVDPDGRFFFVAALFVGKFLMKAKFAKGIIAAVKATKLGKAVTAGAKAVKGVTAKIGAKAQAGKFGKFMKSNFRPIAAGARNVYNNRSTIGSNFLEGLVCGRLRWRQAGNDRLHTGNVGCNT